MKYFKLINVYLDYNFYLLKKVLINIKKSL